MVHKLKTWVIYKKNTMRLLYCFIFFLLLKRAPLFISFQQICIFFQTCLHLVTLPLVLFDTWIFQKRYIQRSLYQMKLYLRHNAVLFLWSYVTKIHCVSLWIWNKEISTVKPNTLLQIHKDHNVNVGKFFWYRIYYECIV